MQSCPRKRTIWTCRGAGGKRSCLVRKHLNTVMCVGLATGIVEVGARAWNPLEVLAAAVSAATVERVGAVQEAAVVVEAAVGVA